MLTFALALITLALPSAFPPGSPPARVLDVVRQIDLGPGSTERIIAAMTHERETINGLGAVWIERPSGDGLGHIVALGDPRMRAPAPRAESLRLALTLGARTLTGTCLAEDVDKVVRRRIGALRACVEMRAQVTRVTSGTVDVRWAIGDTTHDVVVDSADAETSACVARVVQRTRFEAPRGPCSVRWRMRFAPSAH